MGRSQASCVSLFVHRLNYYMATSFSFIASDSWQVEMYFIWHGHNSVQALDTFSNVKDGKKQGEKKQTLTFFSSCLFLVHLRLF